MLTMNSAPTAKRLVVVGPARPSHGRDTDAVRRYRLARLKLEGPAADREDRFAHLKRSYD